MKLDELTRLIQKVDTIPSPSFSLDRILELASNCESDIEQLAEAIESDPAVTARVLRLANSTYFGVPGDVDSVARSIIVVGYKNVLSLATCAALAPAFQGDDRVVDRGALWRHSCATAEAARIVAGHTRCETSIAYVAGLLHDFGIVVLAEVLGAAYRPVWDRFPSSPGSLCSLERAAFGMDHAEAAGVLFERWTLPEHLVSGVVLHDRPGEDATGLAGTVAAGAAVAARFGFTGPSGEGPTPAAAAEAARVLGLSESDVEKIDAEFAERREAVELIAGGAPT